MTTESNENLIGYDPLAWMSDDVAEPEITAEKTEDVSEPLVSATPDIVEEAVKPEVIIDNSNVDITKPEITLDATLNIQSVSALHEKLSKILLDHSVLEIDASAVKMIDTASLQLFVVLKQESIRMHKEVNFEFPSDRFIDAAKVLGIYEMLGLDQASSGFF